MWVHCGYMNETYKIRVGTEERAQWQAAADRSHMTLAAWIKAALAIRSTYSQGGGTWESIGEPIITPSGTVSVSREFAPERYADPTTMQPFVDERPVRRGWCGNVCNHPAETCPPATCDGLTLAEWKAARKS